LITAGASVIGRILTGATAGALIETLGYVNFYLITTIAAVPGLVLFWLMMRAGFVDAAEKAGSAPDPVPEAKPTPS
jgi:PAT family beta-lactamase induction signal transducer AmpG